MSQIIINGQPLYQVDLPEMTLAEWQALPAAERPKEWIRTDAEYTDIPAENVQHTSVSVTADGVKTFGQLLDELGSSLNFAKITGRSYIEMGSSSKTIYGMYSYTSSMLILVSGIVNASSPYMESTALVARSSNSFVRHSTPTSSDDKTSEVVTSGTVITLYYD